MFIVLIESVLKYDIPFRDEDMENLEKYAQMTAKIIRRLKRSMRVL